MGPPAAGAGEAVFARGAGRKEFFMRCGVCSSDIVPDSAERLFEKIRGWGFECVQLSFTSVKECNYTEDGRFEIPWAVPDAVCDMIAGTSERYGVPIEAVNGTFNMAHPDPDVRAEGLARFGGFAKAAVRVGAKMITLCSGTREPSYLWAYSDENDTEQAWRDMETTMRRAVEIAEKLGVTLAIETEASNVISSPEKARKIMDGIGSDKLKMILDMANLFPKGTAKKENVRPTLKRAVDVFGKDVVIMHGKDIKEGDGIDFCGTGDGIVDFPYAASLMKSAGYKGDMFLHGIFDESRFASAREYWNRCWDGAGENGAET